MAAAQAELDQAQKDYAHLRNLQEKDLASAAALERRRDQLHAAEARLAVAKASQGSYARKFAYAELRADRAGIITTVDAEPGQIVTAGQAIVRLAQPEEKEVVISVPENRLQELHAASAIRISLWAAPQHFYTGRLREVSPGVDQVLRTYTAKISVLDADAKVSLGMTATAHVETVEPQAVAWLPLTALTQDNGQPAVWVFDAATESVKPRPVKLAGYNDENAKVLSGITEGEPIVTAGVHKLLAGQKVRLLGGQP
jgi:membrane fusion protein, multidrug efflux system